MKLLRRQNQNEGGLTRSGGSGQPMELNRIRSEINRLFEDPFSLLSPDTSFFEGWTPAVDVHEDKDKFLVRAELPGMRKEDIDVSLDGNTLTISGERKEEREDKRGDTYRSERFFGRFQRTIALPSTVDANKIEAKYENGILNVTLPKTEEAKRKQIQVQGSDGAQNTQGSQSGRGSRGKQLQ